MLLLLSPSAAAALVKGHCEFLHGDVAHQVAVGERDPTRGAALFDLWVPLAVLAHNVAIPALEDLGRRPHVLQADRALKVLLKDGQVWSGRG